MFYSAFVRSFDSSFGNALEAMGNSIARLSYEVKGKINSFILPQQTQHIASILDNYVDHTSKPEVAHYSDFSVIYPKNTVSYERSHVTDNYFYNPEKNEHYLIELKASGDLDNKKARAEKSALLEEYFLLKNSLRDDKTAKVKIFFGTACKLSCDEELRGKDTVQKYFAEDELLIGKDYWNFVCDDPDGFETVSIQYRKTLKRISECYFMEQRIA